MGASWTGGTLLLPEPFREEAVGQGRASSSWREFLAPQTARKLGTFGPAQGTLLALSQQVAGDR